jgi:hypothetical protein
MRWYRAWSALTSVLWLVMFVTIFLADLSFSASVIVIAVFAVVTLGPWAIGWLRGRSSSSTRGHDGANPSVDERTQMVVAVPSATASRLSEWIDRASDYCLARAPFKDPVRAIAAAYRTATIRAEESGDLSPAVLRQALQEWSVPGAYDDPSSNQVRPAYEAWELRMSQHTFRREIARLYSERQWVPKSTVRLPWAPWG